MSIPGVGPTWPQVLGYDAKPVVDFQTKMGKSGTLAVDAIAHPAQTLSAGGLLRLDVVYNSQFVPVSKWLRELVVERTSWCWLNWYPEL